MNPFLNAIFILVFILVILLLWPSNDYERIYIKAIIFITVFLFQFFILLVDKIKNKCDTEMSKLISSSFETALVAVIGYSVFNDLQNHVEFLETDSETLKYSFIALLIGLMLCCMNIIKITFGYQPYDCVEKKK